MMQHCFTISKEFAITDINGNANRELCYNIKRMGKTLCSKDKKDNPLSTFMSYSKSSHRPNACVCVNVSVRVWVLEVSGFVYRHSCVVYRHEKESLD